jgi:hypothetical protein
MADIALTFGGDLAVGATGDIALADGPALTQQRVLRRLLTNEGAYIWQLAYGAGLGQFVGLPNAPAAIQAVARSQLMQEAAIAASPPPSASAADNQDSSVTLTIRYTDAVTQQTNLLTITV